MCFSNLSDSQELLVSYESDQIYTFKILNRAKIENRPTMEDIDLTSSVHERSSQYNWSELASYGGHLNRFTFLKSAKYAGPNDEYICIGSDSGHAWIFERKTGTVAALLGADSKTCNGVVPHSSLPYFITYGIESTAKLWRAANPIEGKTDDSPPGRRNCSLLHRHEFSPVTATWDVVEKRALEFEPEVGVLPDYVSSTDELLARARDMYGSLSLFGIDRPKTPKIGNAVWVLPSVLRANQYECYRSSIRPDVDDPIEQPLRDFTHHVGICRLKHQSDRLGLVWNPWAPSILGANATDKLGLHPSEFVPDFPSDWLNYDDDLHRRFDFHPLQHFRWLDNMSQLWSMFPGFFDNGDDEKEDALWLDTNRIPSPGAGNWAYLDPKKPNCYSQHVVYEAARVCKEGGNVAMKEGFLQAAARRYDKAIQYAAVGVMRYTETLGHLNGAYQDAIKVGEKTFTYAKWSDLLKLLIMCRLNLTLLLMNPEFSSPSRAAEQAQAVLKILAPFCAAEGKIKCTCDGVEIFVKEDEPTESFQEAKTFQAKAHFRLGSALLKTGDFAEAVKSFEASLLASKANPNSKPDSLTMKLLLEARRKRDAKKKRVQNKYQRLLAEEL
jgi:tetratricopeptide (TPR) repeat protein